MGEIMKITLSLLALAATLSASYASALTITVNDNLPDNTYLAAGATLNGSFNINGAVPQDGNYVLPYSIASASATFRFTDNLDTLSAGNPVSSAYTQWYKINNDTWYLNYVTTWHLNPQEVVSLDILGRISTDGTTWYELPPTPAGSPIIDESKTTNNGTKNNPKYNYYYTQYQTGEHGYRGDITLTQLFDVDQLSDLALDGTIDFTLKALEGDMTYLSGALTAELNPNPGATPAEDPTPVPTPEPSTMALLGLGLAGIGIAARRRKHN